MAIRVLPVVVLFLTAAGFAQQRVATGGQPVAVEQPPVVPDPPARENAWSLQVSSTGGITGRGRGTVTVASDGQMSCIPACTTAVSAARVKEITTRLNAIVDDAWTRRTPSGVCSDCMQTTITFKRRDKTGIRTLVATWDDSQTVPPELRELQRLVYELRDSRPEGRPLPN